VQGKGIPLSISSTPSNAKVYIDAEYIGDSPIDRYKISAGSHAVKLTEDGYNDYTENIEIKDTDISKTIMVTMKKIGCYVSISSDPQESSIYIDDKKIDKQTPVQNWGLAPGTYTIKLVKSGYKEYSEKITLLEGENKTISVKLETAQQPPSNVQQTGMISIKTTPSGAKVYINGSYIGITPISKALKQGKYEINLVKEGYVKYATAVTVVKNKTTTIQKELTPISKSATLHISTNPTGANIYIDSIIVGTSPIYFYQISTGVHELRVEKTGYMVYSREIELSANSVVSIPVELVPKP